MFPKSLDSCLADYPYLLDKYNLPDKRKGFLKGEYALTFPRASTTVTVKIVDMLGE